MPKLSLTSSWAVSAGKQQVWKLVLSKGLHHCRKRFETHCLLQHAVCFCLTPTSAPHFLRPLNPGGLDGRGEGSASAPLRPA